MAAMKWLGTMSPSSAFPQVAQHRDSAPRITYRKLRVVDEEDESKSLAVSKRVDQPITMDFRPHIDVPGSAVLL